MGQNDHQPTCARAGTADARTVSQPLSETGRMRVTEHVSLADVRSPLLAPLDSAQLLLLDAIWEPVVRGLAPWPVWDYVARELYRRPDPVVDAVSILDSLPRIPIPTQINGRYGLVWMAGNIGAQPAPGARVGLSIAGLAMLGGTRPDAKIFADALVSFIAMLAAAERDITPDPNREVKQQFSLTAILQRQIVQANGSQFPVPPSVIVDALRREYANPHFTGSLQDPHVAELSPWLRPFFGTDDATDYLARISATAPPQTAMVVVSPLTLAQSLDYLSIVLAQRRALNIKRLVGTANAASFARLALDVDDESDFADRIAALADVLNRLDVPPLDAESFLPDYNGTQPASLERLRRHLLAAVDATSQANIVAAIDDLKATMTMRGGAVHTDVAVRRQYQTACTRLGLTWPVRDWSHAWRVVRARASLAFDAIRREIEISL
jgi:hypothetical protein